MSAKSLKLIVVSCLTAVCVAHCSGQPAPSRESKRQSALALEQQGDAAGAVAAWRSLLASQPSSAEAYAHLGLLEARQEHYKQAIALYRKGLSLNPSFPNLRINLGLSLFKSGDLRGAIEVTGGLTAFTFTKAIGIGLLGLPRTGDAERGRRGRPGHVDRGRPARRPLPGVRRRSPSSSSPRLRWTRPAAVSGSSPGRRAHPWLDRERLPGAPGMLAPGLLAIGHWWASAGVFAARPASGAAASPVAPHRGVGMRAARREFQTARMEYTSDSRSASRSPACSRMC